MPCPAEPGDEAEPGGQFWMGHAQIGTGHDLWPLAVDWRGPARQRPTSTRAAAKFSPGSAFIPFWICVSGHPDLRSTQLPDSVFTLSLGRAPPPGMSLESQDRVLEWSLEKVGQTY